MSEDLLIKLVEGQGRIEANLNTALERIKKHDEEIDKLKLSGARQKGFLAALTGVGGVIGAAAGYAAEYFHRG